MASTAPPERPKTTIIAKLGVSLQWVIFSLITLLVLILASDWEKTNVPNAPIYAFYACITAGAVVALFLFPRIFLRLPLLARAAVYAALVGWVVFSGSYAGDMRAAYEQTPKGAREAADRKKRDAEAVAEQVIEERSKQEEAKSAAETARLDGMRDDILGQMKKLEGCFSTFGHRLPALEEHVKASLHNPAAFEHVETTAQMPEPDGYDVTMTFRAENQFGAVRTAHVRAAVSPEQCSIVKVSEPETD